LKHILFIGRITPIGKANMEKDAACLDDANLNYKINS
jgi:hypothetical protein